MLDKSKSKSGKKFVSSKASATREERRASGQALRDKVSRKTHAGWKAPSRRRDPIDLLIESNMGRIPQLIPIRYGRMMQSPLAFYRGAASIMAADLASTPASGIRIQACGDCHLMNFGAFATPDRRIVFDINDFDETLPAPWEWDVKRLAASFVIAGRNNHFKKKDAHAAALCTVQGYREHMASLAEMSVLERWHESIAIENLVKLVALQESKKKVQGWTPKETSRSVAENAFPQLISREKGKIKIKDNRPLIFHQSGTAGAEFDRVIQDAFRKYRETLADDPKILIDHYEIKDTALKMVGVGSVGTRCGILLLMACNDDPLFLQVKEARTSVLEPYAGKSVYPNRGQRVVAGQRLMQSASDIFLGWTEGRGGRHFYISQLRDIKIRPLVEIYDEESILQYAELCGWALALAHAKSGDPGMLSGYMGRNDRFDRAVADFAVDYADQNDRDHDALLKAIRSGKIEVYQEQ